MKKKLLVVFCILMLSMLALAGTANCHSSTAHLCYQQNNGITVDGRWTSTDEWTDGLPDTFGNTTAPTTAAFRDKYFVQSSSPLVVLYYLIIETNDSTNDAGDYWQICFDGNDTGDAAPVAQDFRIDITGHGSTATWYQGTGTTWTTVTNPGTTYLNFTETLATSSPTFSNSHYILELSLWKNSGPWSGLSQTINQTFSMRVCYYDAHTNGYGSQVWPPSCPRDVPNSYGWIPYTSSTLPEGLSPLVVISLSSIVIVAAVFLSRAKTAKIMKNSNVSMT